MAFAFTKTESFLHQQISTLANQHIKKDRWPPIRFRGSFASTQIAIGAGHLLLPKGKRALTHLSAPPPD